jgi:membrane protease YdiL (CAAX protease family)
MNTSEISTGKAIGRIIVALLLAIAVFVFSNIMAGVVVFLTKNAQLAQPLVHISMLCFSFILILILSKAKFRNYGFKWPKKTSQVLWPILLGSVAGAVATILQSVIPSQGSGSIIPEGYTLPQVILYIWLLASIAEEFLYRGLVQGFLAPLQKRGVRVLRVFSIPVLVSAVLFSAGHLILLTRGVNIYRLIIILAFTLAVGLIAGYWREKSESIIPAVLGHIFANIGGVAAGVVIGIIGKI